jgi:hypothetical protein
MFPAKPDAAGSHPYTVSVNHKVLHSQPSFTDLKRIEERTYSLVFEAAWTYPI